MGVRRPGPRCSNLRLVQHAGDAEDAERRMLREGCGGRTVLLLAAEFGANETKKKKKKKKNTPLPLLHPNP